MLAQHPDMMMAIIHQNEREIRRNADERRRVYHARHRRPR
jgi:hypothetical protein